VYGVCAPLSRLARAPARKAPDGTRDAAGRLFLLGTRHMLCAAGFVTREAWSPQTTCSPCRRRSRQAPHPVCALRRLEKRRGARPPSNTVRLAHPVQQRAAHANTLCSPATRGMPSARDRPVHTTRADAQTVPPLPLLWWGVRPTLPCKPQLNEEPRHENEQAAVRALQVRTGCLGTYVSPLQSAEVPKDVNKVMARFGTRDLHP
jgi:hypothetical protein